MVQGVVERTEGLDGHVVQIAAARGEGSHQHSPEELGSLEVWDWERRGVEAQEAKVRAGDRGLGAQGGVEPLVGGWVAPR
eukprot:1528060-Pleurochrysis_carterae.AAC.1